MSSRLTAARIAYSTYLEREYKESNLVLKGKSLLHHQLCFTPVAGMGVEPTLAPAYETVAAPILPAPQ